MLVNKIYLTTELARRNVYQSWNEQIGKITIVLFMARVIDWTTTLSKIVFYGGFSYLCPWWLKIYIKIYNIFFSYLNFIVFFLEKPSILLFNRFFFKIFRNVIFLLTIQKFLNAPWVVNNIALIKFTALLISSLHGIRTSKIILNFLLMYWIFY